MKKFESKIVILSFFVAIQCFAQTQLEPLEIVKPELLKNPVFAAAPKGKKDLWILNQSGKVLRWAAATKKMEIILDIEEEVLSVDDLSGGNEEGLLGLAFAPNFATTGNFILNHSVSSPRRTVIVEYKGLLKKFLH